MPLNYELKIKCATNINAVTLKWVIIRNNNNIIKTWLTAHLVLKK